jgi:hypothetical protein
MNLGQYHKLTADGNGFTLTYEKEGEVNPATGRPTLTRKITYHSSLEQALSAYVKHCALLSVEAESQHEELVSLINGLYETIGVECKRLAINKDLFTKIDSIL